MGFYSLMLSELFSECDDYLLRLDLSESLSDLDLFSLLEGLDSELEFLWIEIYFYWFYFIF